MCVKLTIIAAALLCLADRSLSAPLKSCWTVQSGIPFARQGHVYIDGARQPNGDSKDFTISKQSFVSAVQIAHGPGYFTRTLNKLPTSKYACTTTNQSNPKWTSVSFSDSTWKYTSKTPIATFNQIALKNDMYCRFYLTCDGTMTTTTSPNTPNNSGDDSSDESADRATTTASTTPATTAKTTVTQATTTTPTTGTPTTSATASPLPTVQSTSGGGSFPAGQPATLQCSFSAVNRPTTVTWFLNGIQLVDSNSNTAIQSDGSLLATYTISAVGAPAAGQYTCQGINANGVGAFGPAVAVALNANYLSSSIDGSTVLPKQLDGTYNQQVLLQASQGCAGLNIQFQNDGTNNGMGSNYAFFDGQAVQIANSEFSSTWPSDCNNQNVWIWIQMSSSTFTVGTGPVIGQNVAVSTSTIQDNAVAYLGVYNFGSGSPTIYLY